MEIDEIVKQAGLVAILYIPKKSDCTYKVLCSDTKIEVIVKSHSDIFKERREVKEKKIVTVIVNQRVPNTPKVTPKSTTPTPADTFKSSVPEFDPHLMAALSSSIQVTQGTKGVL